MSREDFVAQEAFKRLDAIGAQIGELAPVIWSKMVLLTYAESVAYLVVGGICLVFAIFGSFMLARTYNKFKAIPYHDRPNEPPITLWLYLAFVVGFVPAATNLLYPWNWVGAFYPEARLIARLIGAATGSN